MNNSQKNFVFMAFGKSQVVEESTKISRYTGVASVKVLAINPKKDELEKIYGVSIENDPTYVSEVDINGTKYLNAKIDFIVKTTDSKCNNGIDLTTKVTFFLRNQYRFNRDATKVQVIDKYGRTCWVTKEQCQKHEVPMYSNGPANIDKDYRPCYVGEEELTNFIKNYLGIPNVMKYVNNTWVMVDNPQDCECRLEKIENYFKGDFSEIKTVHTLLPDGKVKVLLGVRTTDDNKQYQSVYTQYTMKNNVSDYTKLLKDVNDRKTAGAYSTTEFIVGDLQEYVVKPTDFSESSDLPFGEPSTDSPWAFN